MPKSGRTAIVRIMEGFP